MLSNALQTHCKIILIKKKQFYQQMGCFFLQRKEIILTCKLPSVLIFYNAITTVHNFKLLPTTDEHIITLHAFF